uniref:Small ribosomal subunit protein uS5 n=1 Tax=Myotis lucifugus TaxID=59463 RepID=G1QBJ0_MYOLU
LLDEVRAAGEAQVPGARGGKAEDKEWIHTTKLGRLMKDMKIKSQEEIYFFSLPIKESEIIDFFLGATLKEAVLKIMLLQEQTRTGQRTLFKALVTIGFYGQFGLSVKCSKEVATAIMGIFLVKLSIVPVQGGYWGNKISKGITVSCKVTGCGSVLMCLSPTPRGTGIVSTPVPKLLLMAGIEDCCTSAGCTATLGNCAKATFNAISKTKQSHPRTLERDLFTNSPHQKLADHLVKTQCFLQRTQIPAVATT